MACVTSGRGFVQEREMDEVEGNLHVDQGHGNDIKVVWEVFQMLVSRNVYILVRRKLMKFNENNYFGYA